MKKNVGLLMLAGLLALFTLSACKGAEAVEELEKLKEKTCSCEAGDQECIDEAKEMAKKWMEEYKDARGGDAEKAEQLGKEIAECSLEVALVFAE